MELFASLTASMVRMQERLAVGSSSGCPLRLQSHVSQGHGPTRRPAGTGGSLFEVADEVVLAASERLQFFSTWASAQGGLSVQEDTLVAVLGASDPGHQSGSLCALEVTCSTRLCWSPRPALTQCRQRLREAWIRVARTPGGVWGLAPTDGTGHSISESGLAPSRPSQPGCVSSSACSSVKVKTQAHEMI